MIDKGAMDAATQIDFHDYLLLVVAIILISLALALDVFDYRFVFDERIFWFQRCGSALVVMGLFLESRQRKYTQEGDTLADLSGKPFGQLSPMPNEHQKRFTKVAWYLMLFGTFVWGFGDFFFKY